MFSDLVAGPDAYYTKLFLSLLRFVVLAGALAGGLWLVRRHLTGERALRAFRVAFTFLLYTIVAALVLGKFASLWGFRGDSKHWGLEKMLAYDADRPFAYRVLSPTIVNACIALVPDAVIEGNADWLESKTPLLRYRHRNESWTREKSVAWHVAYLYLFVALMAALYAARAVTAAAGPGTPLLTDVAPAVALLFLPLTFRFGGYMYDFPELALLFLCLIALLRERWMLYYVAFVASVLNKESSVLVVVYFAAVAWGRMDATRFLRHSGAQLVIGSLIVIGLRVAFADNPGAPLQYWFPLNMLFWLQPASYFRFESPYAPLIPAPRTANLFLLFLVVGLVVVGWRHSPAAVRRLATLTAVLNLPLFLVWGFLDEVRALALIFPAFYLLACNAVPTIWSPDTPQKSSP